MSRTNRAVGLLMILASACASQTGLEPVHRERSDRSEFEALELRVPAGGFQVGSHVPELVEPGDEVRMCEVVALPGTAGDTYYVPRIETLLGAQGVELIVLAARPGSDTDAMMEPGASVPCTRAGEAFGEELSEVLATQNRYTDERFRDATGKVFHGGQKLALEVHYVNDSLEPVPAQAKVSFHLANAERVQRAAQSASFANLTIYTPPGGQSSHVGECLVRSEMLVSELVRRTQRYGTTFKVWYAGGARDGELIWDSQDRRDNRFEPAEEIHLLPGEGFRFECAYANPTGRELRYGVSSSDETCTLQAEYTIAADAGVDAEGCLLFDVDPDGVARR